MTEVYDPEIHKHPSALPHQKAMSPTPEAERRALYRIIKRFEEEHGRGPQHVEVAKIFVTSNQVINWPTITTHLALSRCGVRTSSTSTMQTTKLPL